MKAKLNLKTTLSYLLIFAMIFSTMQLGNIKLVKADTTSTATNENSDSTFTPEIILKANKNPITVDKVSGELVCDYINMGTNIFTIEGTTTSDGSNWKVVSAYKIINGTSTALKTSGDASSINGQLFTLSNITDYSDFSFKINLTNGTTTKSYTIKIKFEVESLLQFDTIKVSDASNSADYSNIDFDSVGSDGYYRTSIGQDVTSAKIELLDSSQNVMNSGVTYNGSRSNTVKLVGGNNPVTITVTKNNRSKQYKLMISKKGQAMLKSLVPSAGSLSPAFNQDTYDYTINVPTTQTSIAFTPTTVDNASIVKVDGRTVNSGRKSQDIKLSEGSNKIPITVTANDGDDVITYEVNVIRAEEFRSSNLTALKLTSGALSPTFNKGVYEYTAIVENTITSVGVTATAEDKNATIEVNGKEVPSGATSPYVSLDEGGNIITVKVTDSDDNSSTYVINVTRKYSKNNVNLSTLTVTDGTFSPKFDPETYLYSVKVDRNIEKVKIAFTAQNDKATVKINGTEYKSGQQSDYIKIDIGANLVIVEVTGEDKKATTTYKLSIIRGDIEGTNQWVLVSGNWTFYNGAGVQIKNQWVKYDNQWYFLDINGYMKTGWINESGNWYYLNQNGIMQTGWFYEKGYWYYLQGDGSMRTNCWAQYDGNWYLFNNFGELQTGWTLYEGYWYYMNEKGAMQKGWITYDKNKYYLNDDGTMKNGWLYSGSVWYYFDGSGIMKTGWQTINGKNYYFDANGVMKTGMMFLDGKWINLNNI